jgi:hypothetical protein
MAIQNTVLIGNGPNRSVKKDNLVLGDEFAITWKSILGDLAKELNYTVRDIDEKPLTLVFDEILLHSRIHTKTDLQAMVAIKVAALGNKPLNDVLSCLTKHTLTTNYDHGLSLAHGFFPNHLGFEITPPLFPNIKENTFSLFRGRQSRKRTLWKINGEASQPTSIALGYRQYARYQTQIKNYLTGGVEYSKVKIPNSPLYRGIPILEFEKTGAPYSWVDLFLRDHIHMIGLGMEYTESILWWLLVEKFALQMRYPSYVGGATYHHVVVGEKIGDRDRVKLNMLEDLGVRVAVVNASSYEDGYYEVADNIKPGISKMRKAKDWKGMYKL